MELKILSRVIIMIIITIIIITYLNGENPFAKAVINGFSGH